MRAGNWPNAFISIGQVAASAYRDAVLKLSVISMQYPNSASDIRAVKSAGMWDVFFSLRGSLPRGVWYPAMIAAMAAFVVGILFYCRNAEGWFALPSTPPGWVAFFSWCLGFSIVVALLCAKRLLDIPRPAWLAIPLLLTGLLGALALAFQAHTVGTALAVMTLFHAIAALPALIACAIYDPDDD